ncbi:MAG: hypothetical protein KDA87_08810 [Planctomycetales bacterium]|nr:hypothetical protein [Planctomycetales bacterium]
MNAVKTQIGGSSKKWLWLVVPLGILLLTTLWYRQRQTNQTLITRYGQRLGTASGSIAGTSVLSKFFDEQGWDTASWSRLSPRLEKERVIVWFPDSDSPPSPKETQFLESWLENDYGRTLVIVGRDYNAEVDYWNRVFKPGSPAASSMSAEDKALALRKQAEAASMYAMTRSRLIGKTLEHMWMPIRSLPVLEPVQTLSGPWSDWISAEEFPYLVAAEIAVGQVTADVVGPDFELRLDESEDAASTDDADTTEEADSEDADSDEPATADPASDESHSGDSELDAEITEFEDGEEYEEYAAPSAADQENWEDADEEYEYRPFHYEPLLVADGKVLAARLTHQRWSECQVIIVANGGFLLNLPLIEPGHQRLAEQLVAECGSPDRMVFLESGPRGLLVSNTDQSLPLWLRAFTVFPVNVIVIHLTICGLVYCFYVFPIFGRPATVSEDSPSDFGKHVAAVGDLYEKSGNQAHALQKVAQLTDHHRT